MDISGKPSQPRPQIDKTLTKGLDLLEALAEAEGSRGISDLAQQLSLNKSNVHRLLQTLIRCGYVMREAGTERYLLSSKLWRIARRAQPFDALRRAVRPTLRNLVDEAGESVLFTIIDGDNLIPIDQVETHNPVRVFFTVGQSFPIDQVVLMGKALTALQLVALACRSPLEAQLAARKVQKQLNAPPSFAKGQLALIEQARTQGFAVSRGEWVAGANAVAFPVLDQAGQLIGVLSCFGPADRLSDARLIDLQHLLGTAARELSRRICV